jgi:predicted ribosomally synthesized peptide with nif11-like leader
MDSNMKKFLDAVKESAELQKKVSGKDEASVLAAAKEAGYDITVEDLNASLKNAKELSDDEIEAVAGGVSTYKEAKEMENLLTFWTCESCGASQVGKGDPKNFVCGICGAAPFRTIIG